MAENLSTGLGAVLRTSPYAQNLVSLDRCAAFRASRYHSTETLIGIWDVLPAPSDAVVYSDPLGAPTVARLTKWIETCNKDHEGCHSKETPLLPTRVLDVGSSPSSQVVKLVETSGQRAQYIALSHCWGESNSFMTTRTTIEDMKSGFWPEQAPATLQDAIKVTRQLGICYLWIDSLCIIQGDTTDWEIESSRMGGIYRNAYLTIAASRAAGDSEGFLKPRPPACSALKVVSPSGDSTHIYLRPQESAYDSDDPLDTRAWALQERYLSRRQLRFSKNKIIWQCQTSMWDEGDRDDYIRRGGSGYTITRLLDHPFSDVEWYFMVSFRYSKRQLSHELDRLPALSGLASIVAEHKNWRYCAGIWWEDIGYGICWVTTSPPPKRPDYYIAPSWSWASVIGPITFPDTGYPDPGYVLPFPSPQTLDSVVYHDCQVHYQGSNSYGKVDSGWVRLEAPLVSIARASHSGAGDRNWFDVGGIKDREERANVCFDFGNENEKAGDLWALFLMRAENRGEIERRHAEDVMLTGLIIRRALHPSSYVCNQAIMQTGRSKVYERVGFFTLRTEKRRERLFWGRAVEEIVII